MMLTWARERGRLDLAYFDKRFPQFEQSERGEKQPTFKQLEDFAGDTHTLIGFLSLLERPHWESRRLAKGLDLGMSTRASIIAIEEVCE
jgi:hypothetical protein